MKDDKQMIIKNLCYTQLVYSRVNKKLRTNLQNEEIELFIDKILKKSDEKFYTKTGKNYYVTNTENNIRLTINSNTFRLITVNKIKQG